MKAVVAPTPRNLILPFEKALLESIATALEPEDATLLRKQIACINRVRRLMDWKVIEFQCKRWFRVRWPAEILFARSEKFHLGTIACNFGAKQALVDVWAADGHVASLQSSQGLSGLSISGPLCIATVNPSAQCRPLRHPALMERRRSPTEAAAPATPPPLPAPSPPAPSR